MAELFELIRPNDFSMSVRSKKVIAGVAGPRAIEPLANRTPFDGFIAIRSQQRT
jgi:hypothetical protein